LKFNLCIKCLYFFSRGKQLDGKKVRWEIPINFPPRWEISHQNFGNLGWEIGGKQLDEKKVRWEISHRGGKLMGNSHRGGKLMGISHQTFLPSSCFPLAFFRH